MKDLGQLGAYNFIITHNEASDVILQNIAKLACAQRAKTCFVVGTFDKTEEGGEGKGSGAWQR